MGRASRRRKTARHKRRRRAILRAVPGHTREEWFKRIKEFDNCCVYCGLKFGTFRRATKDHIIPLARGLASTNEIHNVVPACAVCNSAKGQLDLLDWMMQLWELGRLARR